MKKPCTVLILFVISFSLIYGMGEQVKEKPQVATPQQEIIQEFTTQNTFVLLQTISGNIIMELYPDSAPNTVKNFLNLVDKGFYNGLSFHRVIAGFVVQGGDPLGNGTGGPGYAIKAEFNYRPHIDGTLAMARAQAPDSAGSQFYICLGAQPHLDGNYTVFGQVISGLDIVHTIKSGDNITQLKICDKNGESIWYNKGWFTTFEKIEE